MLHSFEVQILADVRSMPGSKWQPQFNQHAFERSLQQAGIRYIHMPALGGKPRYNAIPDAPVKGYAVYMETAEFKTAIQELEQTAATECVAYMCAEASWRNCHRRFISEYMAHKGWAVHHITGIRK